MAEVHITCLCSKFAGVFRLAESIPVKSWVCWQAHCRYNLGALCHSALTLEARPDHVDILKSYAVNEGLTRYFCDTCGSHMFEQDESWRVQSGVVDRIHSEQVFDALEDIAGHRFVHETLDGGLSMCLSGLDASKATNPVKSDVSATGKSQHFSSDPVQSSAQDDTALQASCACGGVEFSLTRPNANSRQCSSPWPDLIVPYYLKSAENPEDVKWWIVGEDKWLAGTCGCRSCRLFLGSPIQAWTFVSRTNILQADGLPLSYNFGSLQRFESSKGAMREFCKTCGATVFWHNEERPGVVDVSVGLLRAPEGVMAKSWLNWWTDRVSFSEEALDKRLIGNLESNLHLLRTAVIST